LWIFFQEVANEVAADKAAAPGNQYIHFQSCQLFVVVKFGLLAPVPLFPYLAAAGGVKGMLCRLRRRRCTHFGGQPFFPGNFPDILLPGNKIVAPDLIIK
jgi:hypothetical protein